MGVAGASPAAQQSFPFFRLADRVLTYAPAAGGESPGAGSVIRGFSSFLE